MGKAVLILGPISAQRFFGQGAVLMGKAVLILGPISAQRSVGSLSVAMGFLCDDGVFVWRSSRDSNPVTIGPVLIFSVTIATPLINTSTERQSEFAGRNYLVDQETLPFSASKPSLF